MEDPVVCADGHSYERAAITQWLLSRDTSPATNTSLLHRNVVPNYALRNLIAEIRGVRRPITFEEHVAAAKPCAPTVSGDDTTGPNSGAALALEFEGSGAVVSAASGPRRDEETASAPEHAAEAAQPINPSKAVCRRPAPSNGRGAEGCSPARAAGKNALHWAMVEGPAAEQKQLWLLLHAELAAQPDQGGNLPLHYAASAGVSAAVVVACALAYLDGLEFSNKTGRTPLDVARLEGHLGIAAVLEGMRNRHSNDLHAAFAAGPAAEESQLRLLRCRPELAGQRDSAGNLPLHVAALHGASPAAIAEALRTFGHGPHTRNDGGFLPHQLALECGHAALAEELAAAAGCRVPPKRIKSVLARAALERSAGSTREVGSAPPATGGSAQPAGSGGNAAGADAAPSPADEIAEQIEKIAVADA